MPKASSSQSTTSHAAIQSSVLKRNQACHQCRKRKLKCDARRPCSTCVRSHSHALAHSQPGSTLPPRPECTFDEVAAIESSTSVHEDPKNRIERLESRILELENLLSQKDKASSSNSASESPRSQVLGSIETTPVIFGPSLNPSYRADPMPSSSSNQLSQVPIDQPFLDPYVAHADPTRSNPHSDMHWSHWPRHLPRPDLLRHLVETFFAYHLHSTRLFHMSTFIPSLSLPPTHPDFPIPAVLHAICAVASGYTAIVTELQVDSLRQETFTDQQARISKEQADQCVKEGQQIFQCLQAYVALSWYYWSQAKWVELFTVCGHSLRCAVPLGLNVMQPFRAISDKVAFLSVISPARSIAEDETRRNVFWLAYAIDRQHGAGTGWALSLADDDIAQILPAPVDMQGSTSIAPEARQWSHLRETLLNHPFDLTDSFTLYIKSTMLLSRVKIFNLRFRAMQHAGDPSAIPLGTLRNSLQLDLRTAPAFYELDDLVISFRTSLPYHLRDPFSDGGMDSHLYTTSLTLHVAMIILHEPHANVDSMRCTSAMKMLVGARGILDLLYAIWSTSYDITLLDHFCPFCWYLAGRIIARFLRAAREVNCTQQVQILHAELDFFRMALNKMGQRVPLASRYHKMLDASVNTICFAPLQNDSLSIATTSILVADDNLFDAFNMQRTPPS